MISDPLEPMTNVPVLTYIITLTLLFQTDGQRAPGVLCDLHHPHHAADVTEGGVSPRGDHGAGRHPPRHVPLHQHRPGQQLENTQGKFLLFYLSDN